jgi:hypothetical protein
MRHLGEALDKVRKAEYARLSGPPWQATVRSGEITRDYDA